MHRIDDNTRRITITAGALDNGNLNIAPIRDFFPPDCVGGPDRKSGRGKSIYVWLEGLDRFAETDIPARRENGAPRWIFRNRQAVTQFFKYHRVQPGDTLQLQRLENRRYALRHERHNEESSRAQPKPRAAEFFAGIGLVRLALEQEGWEVVFANDIDANKAEMYCANFPDKHFVLGDIHDLSVRQIPDCELFTASFPCNDLSIAGAWEGLDGKESSAFWGLIDILKRLKSRRPPLVLLENVVGFLQSHRGQDFESALLALNALGYTVDAVILNATHWVPQSRARLFVIAKSQPQIEARNSYATECDARPDPLCVFINTHPNIKWDIRPVPRLPKARGVLTDVLEDLPEDDPHWWNKDRSEYFLDQLSPRHLTAAKEMIASRSFRFATAFRRVRNGRSMAELRTDGIAGCLRTPRGGSGRQILFKAGRGRYQVRLLTARECARLQGVPDDYQISVPLNQALFGFGDAVCVPAIRWIAEHCLMRLGTRPPAKGPRPNPHQLVGR